MRSVCLTLASILLLTLSFACKKEEKRQPSSGASTVPGAIKGIVKLYDESGTTLANASGITVSLLGTSITFTTPEDGKFMLSNIPAGTYNLKYSKKGYGYFIEQVLITGNGTLNLYTRELYQLSSETVHTLIYDGYDSTTTSYNFTVNLKPSSYTNTKLTIVFPFSPVAEVNITDPSIKIQYEQALRWPNVSFVNWIGKIKVPKACFNQFIKKTIYLKAFITIGNPTIMDPETGLYYYSNFTDVSPEISFKTL